MTNQKEKKLSLDEMQKIDSDNFGGTTKVKVGKFTVTVQKKIRHSEIIEFTDELLDIVDQVLTRKLKLQQTITPLLFVLIIKKFTDVEGIPSDLDGLIQTVRYMIDNDFLYPIINAFDPEELELMNSKMVEIINQVTSGFNAIEESISDIPQE